MAENPQQPRQTESGPESRALPLSFGSFLVSLASSALVHMGEIPDPTSGQKTSNLTLAKQTIDLIEILQQKTQGNLDEEETKLLSSLLYELRMKFIASQNG